MTTHQVQVTHQQSTFKPSSSHSFSHESRESQLINLKGNKEGKDRAHLGILIVGGVAPGGASTKTGVRVDLDSVGFAGFAGWLG